MKRYWLLFAFFALSLPAFAETYHVPGDYPDVQTAIYAASPGDEIVIHGGTWGPLIIDKPLQLLGKGNPAPIIEGGGVSYYWDSPILLAGPGTGTVILNHLNVGGYVSGVNFGISSPGISGSGFSELHIYDSWISGPEWVYVPGLGVGTPGIQVALPFVLIERSTVRASDTYAGYSITSAPNAPPGIEVSGTVAVLDSRVTGGLAGPFCYPNDKCPPGCPAGLGGEGGDGVVCTELFRVHSSILRGEGAPWYCYVDPSSCSQYCCDAADGDSIVTTSDVSLPMDLWGSGPMRLGEQYTLTWSTPGPVAFLYMSPGIHKPLSYGGFGYVFLELSTIMELGPVASPGSLTAEFPSSLALTGYQVAFQLFDPTSGLSRPVSGTWLP